MTTPKKNTQPTPTPSTESKEETQGPKVVFGDYIPCDNLPKVLRQIYAMAFDKYQELEDAERESEVSHE